MSDERPTPMPDPQPTPPTVKVCKKCKENDTQEGGDLCRWCYMGQRFAAFAESCGLKMYPDLTGERYLYALDGDVVCKKSECVQFMDLLWDALVTAKGGDKDLLLLKPPVENTP